MSRTKYIDFRGPGFWAYDVTHDVFLKHVVDAAISHSCAQQFWLEEAMVRWRIEAAVSDLAMSLESDWSPEQVSIVIDLIEQACSVLALRDRIPRDEIESWVMLDDVKQPPLHVQTRGEPFERTGPMILMGKAIISLLRGTFQDPAPGRYWFYGDADAPSVGRWQALHNSDLNRLVANGSDLRRPMTVEFDIDTPDEQTARTVAAAAAKLAFHTSITKDLDFKYPWTTTCTTRMVLNEQTALTMQTALDALARPLGAHVYQWASFGNAAKSDTPASSAPAAPRPSSDDEALLKLLEQGSDLSRPMTVDFQIAAPTESIAQAVAATCSNLSYQTSVSKAEGDTTWTITCSTRMVLNEQTAPAMQAELQAIVVPFGAHANGWHTFGNA